MQISIWQQFASNHSASFSVVGKFESHGEAARAAETIRSILQQLKAWRATNDPAGQIWYERIERGETTPIDQELARIYDVDWPHGVSWFYWTWDDGVTDPVMLFDRYVVIENPFWDIYYGPQPFDSLLRRFGAEVTVSVSESRSHPDTDYSIQLTFTAPTEALALTLEAEWRTYLNTPWDAAVLPPWLAYYEGHRHPDAETLRPLCALYRFDLLSPTQVTGRLYHEIEIAVFRHEQDRAEQLKRRYDELYQQGQIRLTRDQYAWAESAVDSTEVDKDIYERHPERGPLVTRNGTQLVIDHFQEFNMHWGSLVKLLIAITAWLKDQQCTEIDFTFHEVSG